jgi:uncharacterized protein YutE (UPF0331/DUF86 family)
VSQPARAAPQRSRRLSCLYRSLLVHGYVRVELERVHELLNAGLDDSAEFARHVERFLQRS